MYATLTKRQVKSLRDACAGETRPKLARVHIRSDGVAEASNGHVLVQITLDFRNEDGEPVDLPDEGIPEYLIPADVLRAVTRQSQTLELDPSTGALVVEENGNYMTLDPGATPLKREVGEYPLTDSLWPADEPKAQFALNGQYMKRVAALAQGSATKRVQFEYHGPTKALVATFDHDDTKVLVMPMRLRDGR